MQIGLGGLVFIVFLYLKLHGDITWSWVWVTSPLWIAGILTLLFLGGVGVAAFRQATKAEQNRRAFQDHLSGRRRGGR